MISNIEANFIEYMYNTLHPEEKCLNPPHQYFIDVANYCNLDCEFCIQDTMDRQRGFMDFSLFQKIINSIVDCYGYIPCVDLSRQGDPLMNPKISEYVKYAKDAGCGSLRIQTNGKGLTEGVSRALIEAGLDKINFSFGSHDKKIYESVQRKGNFEKTLLEIVRFLELRKEYGRMDMEIVISTVDYGAFAESKETFAKVFALLPFDKVKINPFMNWLGRFPSELGTRGQNIDRAKWPMCKLPWRILAISCEGTAVACNNDWNHVYAIGDMNAQSVEEVWNGDRMRQFRRSHITRDYESVMDEGCTMCATCGEQFEDPRVNGPTYPVDFRTGLWEMVNTGIVGGGRENEPLNKGQKMNERYEYLDRHRDDWLDAVLSGNADILLSQNE